MKTAALVVLAVAFLCLCLHTQAADEDTLFCDWYLQTCLNAGGNVEAKRIHGFAKIVATCTQALKNGLADVCVPPPKELLSLKCTDEKLCPKNPYNLQR